MAFLKTESITTTIYEYDRGDKIVKVDPALVWRRINMSCRDMGVTFDQLMKQWNDVVVRPDDTEIEISKKNDLFADLEPRLETVARQAFQIPPLDEEGHGGTIGLALSTLNEFLSEREKKSSNTETLPSSSPLSAGDQPDSSKACSESNASTRMNSSTA